MTELIAGVDEAGRGPLAGPVAVAAVILGPGDWAGIDDSKQLSAKRREAMAEEIRRRALCWNVVMIDAATIDEINILVATEKGMRLAVRGLSAAPQSVLVDGNRCPKFGVPSRAIVGGDGLEKCIGAASILAKTQRDAYMCELDQRFPAYGFARHKGYGTAEHLTALRQHGPTPEHRRSFAPLRESLQAELFDQAGRS